MNAMDRQHLDITVYTPSYFKKLSTILISFQVFSVRPTSLELEELISKTYWKGT